MSRSHSEPMSFFLRMEPEPPRVTHQQKKAHIVNGKPFMYEPQRLKDARAKFAAFLKPLAPAEPFSSAVRVDVLWIFRGKTPGWFVKRPDCSNLQKLIEDVMTDVGFWQDDSIVMPSISKIQLPEDAQHGVKIDITPLESFGGDAWKNTSESISEVCQGKGGRV